ncbi:MAG: hypothetical protein KAS32_05580 [Candidatus Peribacteraceae bacterium]|nr:hypothetical protein [Candidatus Peribacteraceae bacterium]
MKIAYKDWNPKLATMELVLQAESIIEEYQQAGYVLTLRQLYYQFVARGIVENSERSYDKLGNIITQARMAGMISWEAIEDRSREHKSFWYDEDELNPIRDLPRYIRFDQWARQDYYVEVWVEKEALGNVISRACTPYLVPHLSCKGYLSASEAWRAGMRFRDKMNHGKECVLIHLGDHDPSGIDMTRDNRDRMNLFTETLAGVTVTRLALNMNQVDEYSPPPNPAKITDSRAKDYIRRFGKTSWELDALEPQVMERMIQDEIMLYVDKGVWDQVRFEQDEKQQMLGRVFEQWDQIKHLVE